MSPVIYEPPPRCDCRPPTRQVDYDGSAVPAYPVDTIWACDDCGQRWIVEAETYGAHAIADRIAGRTYERTSWARHDKDTP